jgi:hypothetical protein
VRLLDLVAGRIAALEFGIARYMGNFGSERAPNTQLKGDASGPKAERYRRLIGKMRDRDARILATGSSSSRLEDSWIVGKGDRVSPASPSVSTRTVNPAPKGFQMIPRPSSRDANYTKVYRAAPMTHAARAMSLQSKLYRSRTADTDGTAYVNPRRIEVVGRGGQTSAIVTKYGPRNAVWDLLDSDNDMIGKPKGAGNIRSLMKHFKKNKVSVDFQPHAMADSGNKGAVTQTGKLLKSYTRIAKKMGFKRGGTALPRFVP